MKNVYQIVEDDVNEREMLRFWINIYKIKNRITSSYLQKFFERITLIQLKFFIF